MEKEDELRVKAAEFLIESLKMMVTISMLFVGGIVAYGGYIGFSFNCKYFYVSVSMLVLASLFSVFNINSIINKIYAGVTEAIRVTEVRVINLISILTLIVGIFFGVYSVIDARDSVSGDLNGGKSIVISDDEVLVDGNPLSHVKIVKKEGEVVLIEMK